MFSVSIDFDKLGCSFSDAIALGIGHIKGDLVVVRDGEAKEYGTDWKRIVIEKIDPLEDE